MIRVLIEELIQNPEIKICVVSFPKFVDCSDIKNFVEFDVNKSFNVFKLNSDKYDVQYGIVYSIFDAKDLNALDVRYHEKLFKIFCEQIKCPTDLISNQANFYFTPDVITTKKTQQYNDYKNSATSKDFDELHKQLLPEVLRFFNKNKGDD